MDERDRWRQIDQLAGSYKKSSALFAALELGIYDHVGARFINLNKLAALIDANPQRLQALLDIQVHYGFMERQAGRYRVSALWHPLTNPDREDNLQARYAHNVYNSRSWMRAADAIRADRPVSQLPPPAINPDQRTLAFHRSLGARGQHFIRPILDGVSLPRGARILDVGGGFGDLCRPFLERDAYATAVLLETPETAELARLHLSQLGLGERVSVVATDFTRDPLPEGFDLILLSNILHIYAPPTNIELLETLFDAAADEGLILIREIHIESDRSGPLFGLEFALNMAINTENGDAYSADTVKAWLTRTGWRDPRFLETPDDAHHYALLAVKSTTASTQDTP